MLFLAVPVLACRPSRPQAGTVALSSPDPIASLLRLPRNGGSPKVYRLPTLAEDSWAPRDALPKLDGVIGTDLDNRIAYARTGAGGIIGLELESGRVQTALPNAGPATIGPDGVLYAVGDSGRIVQMDHRTPTRFTHRLPPGHARELFGMLGETVTAILGGKPDRLVRLDHDQVDTAFAIPEGPATATMWGDLVAVAADTAVIVYQARRDREPQILQVSHHAREVAFSASGHRLYVAEEDPSLLQFDRFTWKALARITLPGPPAELRPDPFGQWLLVKPAQGDSVWVVDLSRSGYLASWPTPWDDDLPAVAGGRVLLVRQGRDVVAYDLGEAAVPEVGRVRNGAGDLWLPVPWKPGPQTQAPHADTATVAVTATPATGRIYLQISSSQNPQWAAELARSLKAQGLAASVIRPRSDNDAYRVVIGPYDTRDEAEAAGQKLDRPYFIYQDSQDQ